MKSVNIDRVLSKLNNLIENRFGVNVEYVSMVDRSEKHTVIRETARRNASASMIVAHNKLIVPMRVQGTLVGAAQVLKINELSPVELSHLKDSIDLVLGEALNAQAIWGEEEQIQALEAAAAFSNVIPIVDWLRGSLEPERVSSGI